MAGLDAGADVARVKREVEEIIGLDCSDAIECSAKKVRLTHMLRLHRTSSCLQVARRSNGAGSQVPVMLWR